MKFRLKNDLNLADESSFYIPYLAGEFDGKGHKVFNLSFNSDFVCYVGLFGYLAAGGKVTQVGVENANITGDRYVGGLVGRNEGTVSNSCSSGSVTGGWEAGALVGYNSYGMVSNSCSSGNVAAFNWYAGGLVGRSYGGAVSGSYSTGAVTGDAEVGGLVGRNEGTVSNCYASASVAGDLRVGGLVGRSYGTIHGPAIVRNSFWDRETSGMEVSDGGTGKTTVEMQNIATFVGAAGDIIAVAPEATDAAHTWNIVDGQTYPFLSWES